MPTTFLTCPVCVCVCVCLSVCADAAKCLRWLREDYARLNPAERFIVDDALKGSGVELLFGKIGGWPKPGMGSAVLSDGWFPTMGDAKL